MDIRGSHGLVTLQSSNSQLASPKRKAVSVQDPRFDWWSVAAITPAIIVLLGFLILFFYGVFQSLADLKFGRPLVHFIGLNNFAASTAEWLGGIGWELR